eukprot:GGOE01042859.1.p2 GENE.GGOE01042859.1~~GGOE01042859.1.p2  ORF type:complete len:336 (+),score=100.12 GGOE01042859.1:88-1095(+)
MPRSSRPLDAVTHTTALLERRSMFFEDVFASSIPQAHGAARCIQRAIRCHVARRRVRQLRRQREQQWAEQLMEQPVGQAVDLPAGVTVQGVLSRYETGLLEQQERVKRKLMLNEERVVRADLAALKRWLQRGKPLVEFQLHQLEHEELHVRMRLWREQDEGMADLTALYRDTGSSLRLDELWQGRQGSATRLQKQWRSRVARRLRRALQAQREEAEAEEALKRVEEQLRRPRLAIVPPRVPSTPTLPPLAAATLPENITLPDCTSPAVSAPPVMIHPCTADSLPLPERSLPAVRPKKSTRKLMKGVFGDMRTRLQAMQGTHGDALLPLLSTPAPR